MKLFTAVFLIALSLALPSVTFALPFTPNEMFGTVLGVRFVESGTDTICLHCGDADPLNDFRASLMMEDLPPSDTFFSGLGGAFDFTGTTATDFSGLSLNIEIDMRVVLQETMWPDEMAEYPLPSVAVGTLTGTLVGMDRFLLEDCCGGIIGGIFFNSVGYPPTLWELPNPDFGYRMPINIEAFTGGEAPYTPAAVPEPASLLLLGPGLAVFLKRRIRARKGTSARE